MKDSALPETWQCDQNPDAAYASCDVPQELPDDDIDRLLGLLPPKPVVKASGKRAERADEFAPMPGGAPPICGQSLGEVMDQLVKKAKLTEAESRTIHWHLANLEYGCATDLHNVSLSWWDQDDSHEIVGEHVLVRSEPKHRPEPKPEASVLMVAWVH